MALAFLSIGTAAQSTATLKDYSYPSDGFAIKFAYALVPHADRVDPERKVYTVRLGQRAGLSVRIIVDSQSCDSALEKYKRLAASQNIPIREFSVSGRPAWEEKEHRRPFYGMVFERYVCGRGRFYVLTLGGPENEARPRLGQEMMDSFRLAN